MMHSADAHYVVRVYLLSNNLSSKVDAIIAYAEGHGYNETVSRIVVSIRPAERQSPLGEEGGPAAGEANPGCQIQRNKERDIQVGREYAAQVERQMRVVSNQELTAYINRVGKRLVATGLLDQDFPYSFKVVQEPSINAFALPGGPMFVHTGLIAAAGNQAQMAGVLAHELSHVSLRDGIADASKQQTISGLGGLAGAVPAA